MMAYLNSRRWIFSIWLSLLLVIPSIDPVYRYTGLYGLLSYVTVTYTLSYFVTTDKLKTIVGNTSSTYFKVASVLILIFVIISFIIIYPIADSGFSVANFGEEGVGTDRDEALNIAVSRLFEGKYPYSAETYLGNPITPLPGAVILSSPFVLILGNSAYQNIFWLVIFFALIASITSDIKWSTIYMAITVGLSPYLMYEVVMGEDLLSNSLFCLVSTHVFVVSIDRKNGSGIKLSQMLASLFLALSLSSRPNFFFLFFLIASYLLVKNMGNWTHIIITLFFVAIINLPFYFWKPNSFSPLHVSSRLQGIKYSNYIILGATFLGTAYFSFFRDNPKLFDLYKNYALMMSVPVLTVFALQTWSSGMIATGALSYGIFFMFPGIASLIYRHRDAYLGLAEAGAA